MDQHPRTERIVFVGETGVTRLGPWWDRFDHRTVQAVCILSSHETLIRDCALAKWLRIRGHQVCGQSRRCATLAVDKNLMKRSFDEAGLWTPQWANASTAAGLARSGLLFVRKVGTGHWSAPRLPESADLVARLPASVIKIPGLGRPDRQIGEVLAPARAAPGRVAATVTTGVLRHGPHISAIRDSITSWQRGIAEQIDRGAIV